jgi:hypothetical protein
MENLYGDLLCLFLPLSNDTPLSFSFVINGMTAQDVTGRVFSLSLQGISSTSYGWTSHIRSYESPPTEPISSTTRKRCHPVIIIL